MQANLPNAIPYLEIILHRLKHALKKSLICNTAHRISSDILLVQQMTWPTKMFFDFGCRQLVATKISLSPAPQCQALSLINDTSVFRSELS